MKAIKNELYVWPVCFALCLAFEILPASAEPPKVSLVRTPGEGIQP